MRMAIPELHINPIDRIIKTVTGDLASVFIDFVPARQGRPGRPSRLRM